MAIQLINSTNANVDLTSQVTILNQTPDVSNARKCQVLVMFGDGVDDLDGTGGDFEITIQVGSNLIQPSPQVVTFGTVTQAAAYSIEFIVPPNTAVVVKALSPNVADTDVDVTTKLYDTHSMVTADINKIADHVLRRTLANARASSDGDALSARSILGAMCKLSNRVAQNGAGTKLQIYEEDDTTLFFQQTITKDASAQPIIEVNTD